MAFFHKANDDEKSKIFGDKVLFLEAFNKFVKRDWIDINKATFDDYCNFVNKHEKFIKKPTDLSCGRGISLDKKRDDIKNQYLDLKSKTKKIVDDFLKEIETIEVEN